MKSRSALKNWNVNLPTGTINGPRRAFTLQASGQLMTADAYKPVIIAYRNNTPVRLEELGTLTDSVEDDKTASWYYTKQGHERAIILSIQRQPGTNTVQVAEAVKKLLPTFRAELPPSVKMDIFYDRSETIKESYDDVKFTMMLTLGLVIMVIFLFLRNVSATIIPSLALPFSVVGTFAVMYLLGYSLDNLSMMALILAIGFVVDDAIVMLENIVRHMEMGRPADAGRPRWIARDRIHDRFDDHLAGGGVHSGAVHGRSPGPPVPRVRGHHLRLDSDLRRGLDHADADDVQPLPALVAREQAIEVLPRHGRLLRRAAAPLRPVAGVGAAASLCDSDELLRRAGRDRVAVHHHPQGIRAGPGYRSTGGDDGSRAGHRLRADVSNTSSGSPRS